MATHENKGESLLLNTDIFRFEFVDRKGERQAIDEYLSDFSQCTPYALWMRGERGNGKSFFLSEYVIAQNHFSSVYVNPERGNMSSGSYLKLFISQLNKAAKLKFSSYLRANYSSIAAIGQKAINVALNLADLDDIGLDELSSTIANYFVSKCGEKDNTVAVIRKYINEALKKCERIVVILDNFSQCDQTSLDVISAVIHELAYDTRLKYIICTTDEDLDQRFDIKSVLAEKIPNKPLNISPLQHKQLFVRMLERTFDLDEANIKLLSQAFDLCSGIPQKFKELLINIYTAQGIIIDGRKARFASDIFKTMIIKGEISFDIDALCQKKKAAKTVLQIISFWGGPISPNILYEVIEYIANIDSIPFFEKEIAQVIQELEALHILSRTYENRTLLLQFKHDSVKIAVSEYFREDNLIPFLHFCFYEYLMTREDVTSSPYWQQYYKSLRAYHSYAAHADDWIEYNYQYGQEFFEKNMFEAAETIFLRLESALINLTARELLTIGKTFFFCGQYQKTDNVLSMFHARKLVSDLGNHDAIHLYLLQAYTKSCLLNSVQALAAISEAEKLCRGDNPSHIKIQGAKQSILFLLPGGFSQAKEIFDDLIRGNCQTHEMALVYQSAMDYYEGDESKALLNKGLLIARKYADKIIEGKILNNLGFESLRCGEYVQARQYFDDSIKILGELQPHEQAYSYSNRAVLHMISKDWEQALGDIIEALFWNKSNYASLVLKTNRMLCYFFMGNQQWEDIYQELYYYIASNHCVDDKIYKKICINMALLASETNQFSAGIDLLERCHPHLESELPHWKYRFLRLYQKLTGTAFDLLPIMDMQYRSYYCDIEFEPWLLNFSHD